MFVDWRYCGTEDLAARCASDRKTALAKVYGEVEAANVLKTSLTNGDGNLGQIGSYLSQKDWFKAAVTAMAEDPASAAAGFCLHIKSEIAAVGLSTVDAGIAVWAVTEGMADLPDAAHAAFKTNSTCKGFTDPITKARIGQS